MAGIISYGFYVPQFRIKTEAITSVWGKAVSDVTASLRVYEKTVSDIDEDSLTMAFEASSMALDGMKLKMSDIKVVFFGSETPPYAVNPSSTILAQFLGIEKQYLAADMQFACKAGTGAMIAAAGLITSGYSPYALVVASDKASGRPHDALEYTAASGSVAFLMGTKDPVLEIEDMVSFSSDTPDFWRREGIRFPSHGGRFTGKPSYFHHVMNASSILLKKNRMKPGDFSHAVFHMPNGKFPRQVAASLGFTQAQIQKSLVVEQLGNSYTASSLMGLVSVLDETKAGERIFFASYGSGAGSDAFMFRVTPALAKRRRQFQTRLNDKKYITYETYLRYMNNL